MVIHTTETPSGLDNNNAQQITLGVGFQLDVASKTCYGVRFWAPATNTGTYTALLYVATADDATATGTELARKAIASTSITAGAWNIILFDTPVSMANTNLYKVAVHTSSGRYVNRNGVFSGASLTGDNITLYANGSDPIGLGTMFNGVFRDNALNYPATTFSQSDYYVEPITTTSGLSASIGRATVAESDRAVGAAKARSAGRVTESHTARTATRAKASTAGRVTVSEAARATTRTKAAALSRVSTADTGRAVSSAKISSAARVSVAESSRLIARTKAAALGRATTSEVARPSFSGKARSIGRAGDISVARTVSGSVVGSGVLVGHWGADMGLG